jgi:hypothetical protein
MNPFLLLYSSKVLYNFIYYRMRITNKSIYIHNRDRRVYAKGNKFYYIHMNNYKLVPASKLASSNKSLSSVFRGGAQGDDSEAALQKAALQKAELERRLKEFKADKDNNKKLKLLAKHYGEAFDHLKLKLSELLNYIVGGIKFLNIYRDKIKRIIGSYKIEELSKAEANVILSTIKKILFSNIFENYFLDIISNISGSDDIEKVVKSLSISREGSSLTKKFEEIKTIIANIRKDKTQDADYKDYYFGNLSKNEEEGEEEGDEDGGDNEEKDEAIKSAFEQSGYTNDNSELTKNKDKLKDIFNKYFELRKTSYWWDKIKDTIKTEIQSAKTAEDNEHSVIIKEFLKALLKKTIDCEITDSKVIKDDDEDMFTRIADLENLKTKLEDTSTSPPKLTTNIDNIKQLIDLINSIDVQTPAQPPAQENSTVVTKTDMIILTNNMILLLKCQIYDLYTKYIDIIGTYDFNDKINEVVKKFEISLIDKKKTEAPPESQQLQQPLQQQLPQQLQQPLQQQLPQQLQPLPLPLPLPLPSTLAIP